MTMTKFNKEQFYSIIQNKYGDNKDIIAFLSRYDCVTRHKGTLNEYIDKAVAEYYNNGYDKVPYLLGMSMPKLYQYATGYRCEVPVVISNNDTTFIKTHIKDYISGIYCKTNKELDKYYKPTKYKYLSKTNILIVWFELKSDIEVILQ